MSETAAEWLASAGAQRDVVAWAERFGSDWSALWSACPRGDWLLAIAARRGVSPERIASASRSVATLALDHVEGAEREALEAALAAPSSAAADAIDERAAASQDPSHQAALSAVALAVRGVVGDAAMVPAFIVQAAAMDAADCGMSAAVSYVQRRSAELVREVIATP
jgi:hypothetical protein